MVGCEALARLGPDLDAVSPVAFVPVAEDTGLIASLDEAVFTRAAHEVLAVDRARGGGLSVAVNLSPRSLQVPGLADRLAPTLGRLGLDGQPAADRDHREQPGRADTGPARHPGLAA